MDLKIFAIILLIFQLKICVVNSGYGTIEEYLNKQFEVIRTVTGSYQDQMMSESDAEITARRERFVKDPIECIKELKLTLKSRILKAVSADKYVKKLKSNNLNILHIHNKRKLRTGHSKLSFSRVNKVFLPYNVSSTVKQLNEELVANNILISDLKSTMKSSTQTRADESDSTELNNIKAINLILTGKNHPFQDALTSTKPAIIFTEEKILESMATSELTISGNRINKIPLDKLLNVTSTRQVTGEKSFKSLTVDELEIDDRIANIPKSLFKQSDEAKLNASRRIEFQGDINVKHLKAKAINRLNLTAFMNDVLLKDNDMVLNGDLIIESLLNTDDLKVNFVSKIPVNNFMRVDNDQNVASSVFITKFYTSSLTSPLINGEEFSPITIATINSPNIIAPRTRFMDISVIRNLNVEGVQGESTKEFVDMIKRHVIGTKTSDLFQLYNGHVIIQGSLTIDNVQFQSINTNVIVGNMKIFQNLVDNYWMKSIKQNILAPNFVVNNEVVATAGVVAANLNGHLMEKYLLVNVERPQGSVWLRFENVAVNGDVKGHKSNEPSRIFLLSATAVPRNSLAPIEILGNVEFRNELIVKRLRTAVINSHLASSLIHKNMQTIVMEAPVVVNSLSATSIFIDRQMQVKNYNNVELSKLAENILRLSQGLLKVQSMIIDRFEALNLQVDNFEGIPLDAMVTKLQQEFDNGATRERVLTIHGDVIFNKNVFVERLNSDTIINEFFSNLALKNLPEVLKIGGRKIFQHYVETKHLQTDNINKKSANRLLNLSLSRGVKQTIKESVTIKNLNVDKLHTNYINDHPWTALVSKKNLHLPLIANLHLNQLIVKDLNTDFAVHDFNSMIQSILFPKRVHWSYINATKETMAVLSPSSELYQLFSFGVDKHTPQDIFSRVHIVNGNLYIKSAVKELLHMNTRLMDIDLYKLIYDSVQNYAPHAAIIKGPMRIPVGNRIDANNLFIDKRSSFICEDINGINIKNLNNTFFRGGNLTGIKQFNYIHVDEFTVKGRINGIYARNLITIHSKLLEANFQKLEVKELYTYSINQHSFQYFLENRLRKYGKEQFFSGMLQIGAIHFDNNMFVPYINDVPIDACIYRKSYGVQDMRPHLIVNGKITFIGPVNIVNLNGVDFRRQLDDSVSRHQDFSCEKITLNDVELKNGLKISGIINNRDISELLESGAHSPKLVDLMALIANIQKQDSVIESRKGSKYTRLRMMYLDTDDHINTQYKMLRSHEDSDESNCSSSDIDFEPHAKGFLVSKRNNLMFEMSSIKAEVVLPCSFYKLEVKWKYANGDQFNQTFGDYSKGITTNDVFIFETPIGDNYMLIKVSSSIVTLRLDKSTHKWIEIPQTVIGLLKNVRIISIVQTPQLETYLIVLNQNTKDILIYELCTEFILLQNITPSMKFDIVLNLNVAKSSTFLIFAKTSDRKVFIYRFNRDVEKFVFQQLLDETLDDIVSVIVLHINDEPFIVISKKSGVFCFYQWRGIENWQQRHCGKFKNLQLMKSFEYLNKQRIFLASSINSNVENVINALVIHKQGG